MTGGDDFVDSVDDLGFNRAHSARVFNRWLGGKDNYYTDQAVADAVQRVFPSVRRAVRANRDFMVRSTRVLAGAGVGQFLDIGIGVPAEPNVHEVAQEVNPAARVAYVDNDLVVLAHARALLRSTSQGRVEIIRADASDPGAMLEAVAGAGVLDLSQPVAVSLLGILPLFIGDDEPYKIVDTVAGALAPGSYLSLTHLTDDFAPEIIGAAVQVCAEHRMPVRSRSRAEFARFFEGRELIAPGITAAHRWHPRPGPAVIDTCAPAHSSTIAAALERRRDARISLYAAVARVP